MSSKNVLNSCVNVGEIVFLQKESILKGWTFTFIQQIYLNKFQERFDSSSIIKIIIPNTKLSGLSAGVNNFLS